MKKQKAHPRESLPLDKFVGARIRMARITAGLSQDALGDKLGVSFQQVQKYEKGVNRVSASRLSQIGAALGQTVQWFLDEPETAAGRTQDEVMTRLLSTARGRELATNYLAAADPAQQQLLSLSRTFAQMAA